MQQCRNRLANEPAFFRFGGNGAGGRGMSLQQKPETKLAVSRTEPTDLSHVPMSQELGALRDVLLVPWGTNEPPGAKRAAGLFDANGVHLPQGDCLRYDADPLTVRPEYDASAPVDVLKGRYLYGGMAYSHFGHFLCESTGRLWALDHAAEFDGVVWLPKNALGHPAKQTRHYDRFFKALGRGKLVLTAPQAITRIEELVIPEQGFGIGALSSGRPQYRDFMRRFLGADIAAKGGERLYVSRSGLNTKRGSVLLERRIEALMQAEGYEVFHPQDHRLSEQIARYKAAKAIVALDGSALYLAAMVLREGAKVAIINRGPSQNIDDYTRQFRHFAGIEPVQIEAIRAYWFEAGRRVVKRETHALLDLPAVGAALAEAGMIGGAAWPEGNPVEIAGEISDREARGGSALQRYEMVP